MKRRNYCLSQKEGRRVVSIVGSGINDTPVCLHTTIFESFRLILLSQALTAANVGIAMGSGTDIVSSAHFVLLSSNFHTLLILTDLSRKVLRRVKFHSILLVSFPFTFVFCSLKITKLKVWATMYNIIAFPRCYLPCKACEAQSRMVVFGNGIVVRVSWLFF